MIPPGALRPRGGSPLGCVDNTHPVRIKLHRTDRVRQEVRQRNSQANFQNITPGADYQSYISQENRQKEESVYLRSLLNPGRSTRINKIRANKQNWAGKTTLQVGCNGTKPCCSRTQRIHAWWSQSKRLHSLIHFFF